ncbi:hypothetical protein E2562_028624 [Oryza meyeriana var. granulata]|uniref:Uncharacterized protein n=1 Tax=Oryza meyeriana var. granulata TaxID=110450 RepID=A0A6G1FCV4_9ORYZ|nr:hypothetical protein E2562_028624 [Oryza meyeriana var. granulata]
MHPSLHPEHALGGGSCGTGRRRRIIGCGKEAPAATTHRSGGSAAGEAWAPVSLSPFPGSPSQSVLLQIGLGRRPRRRRFCSRGGAGATADLQSIPAAAPLIWCSVAGGELQNTRRPRLCLRKNAAGDASGRIRDR